MEMYLQAIDILSHANLTYRAFTLRIELSFDRPTSYFNIILGKVQRGCLILSY